MKFDKVARIVKVSQVDTPYFTIVAPANAYQKVAPGVALVFRIQFKPEEQRVCIHIIFLLIGFTQLKTMRAVFVP